MNLTCKTCAHVQKDSSDVTGQSLLCFRRPPTAFPVTNERGIVGTVSLRPRVTEKDVACGDFEPRFEVEQ